VSDTQPECSRHGECSSFAHGLETHCFNQPGCPDFEEEQEIRADVESIRRQQSGVWVYQELRRLRRPTQ